jgi:hypothetical protein
VALHHLVFCHNLGRTLAHDRMTLFAPEDLMLQMASLFDAEGFPEVAMELCLKTLEAHPASAKTAANLAEAARKSKRQDVFDRACEHLRDLQPDHPLLGQNAR